MFLPIHFWIYIREKKSDVLSSTIYTGPRSAVRNAYDYRNASQIQAQSLTFVEIYNELIYTAILLPSTDSRRVVLGSKRKYVHGVLVNGLAMVA